MSSGLKYSLFALAILLIVLVGSNSVTLADIRHLNPASWGQYLIDQQLIPQGPAGILVLFLFLSITTAIGLPRQVAAFVSGYSFGGVYGAILATLAATIGCLLTFSVARHILSHRVTAKYPKQIGKVSAFIEQQTLAKTIIIRLLPLGSNLMTNILAGVTRVSAKPYVLGSLLGFIPQMLIFSFAGSGVKLADEQQVYISFALFIAIALLGSYLLRQRSLTPGLSQKRNS
ncbi:TVP38/TMEM64 family protein [Thalassomonas haliotis]|uniref:TVP38/TMEM64 family membrane protein n=1 Tax=Thalassomonas haliotis TaxID=485448 RepID=A0ABY7VF73_9GAMM|nr:VTT domain-containing protein [Thalassomonas haliotis]WDE12223.1 VTT domain-containing protein [Thalassomonas haliotis]